MKKEDVTYFELGIKKSDINNLSSIISKINRFAFAKRNIPYSLILKLHKIIDSKSNLDFEITKIDVERRALLAFNYFSKQKDYDFRFTKKTDIVTEFNIPSVEQGGIEQGINVFSLENMITRCMWNCVSKQFGTKDEAITHVYSNIINYTKVIPPKKIKHLTKYKLAVIAAYITMSNGVKILDTLTGKITNQRLFQAARPAIIKYEKLASTRLV